MRVKLGLKCGTLELAARRYNRLTALRVQRLKDPGRYTDGDGLALVITPDGGKRWVFRYSIDGRRRDMGFGPARIVTLAEARTKAINCRKMILDGVDPLAHKRASRQIPYFGVYARELHAKIKHQWKNPKHAAQWLSSLETYAMPVIGEIRLNRIDAPLVRQVLTPIWYDKPETARRVRQRIAQVLDAAAADGFRHDANPASAAMAGLAKVKHVQGHHAAMPYAEVPTFVGNIRDTDMQTLSKLAFEFIILTAARTNEVLKSEWAEIDWENRLWRVPGDRMKAGRLHEVPLAERSLALLKEAEALSGNSALIFPRRPPDTAFSNMVFLTALRRMGIQYTVHGFRSSFRDWAAEKTAYPREIAEFALAHTIKSKTEAAYQRSTLLDQRRSLMEDWAEFLGRAK